jgi:hypothetical protein
VLRQRRVLRTPCGVLRQRRVLCMPCGVLRQRHVLRTPCGVLRQRHVALWCVETEACFVQQCYHLLRLVNNGCRIIHKDGELVEWY